MGERWEAATHLALRLWQRTERTLTVSEMSDELADALEGLTTELPHGVATHQVGSGTLLVRNAEGGFSFVHQSVMEWLVARRVARELEPEAGGTSEAARELEPEAGGTSEAAPRKQRGSSSPKRVAPRKEPEAGGTSESSTSEAGSSEVLAVREISVLMADFVIGLAGRARAAAWAREATAPGIL